MKFIKNIFKLFQTENEWENSLIFQNSKTDFLIILKDIENTLRNGQHDGQAVVVERISDTLLKNDYLKFKKEINSIDMWGGSGAVWEVYFHDNDLQRKFNSKMLKLIDLMERTKILGRGIKPLKELFKNNTSDKSR